MPTRTDWRASCQVLNAQAYANSEAKDRVVVIDGLQLTDLMLTYAVGVQTKRTLELREIDEDFFE